MILSTTTIENTVVIHRDLIESLMGVEAEKRKSRASFQII